jgi:hypothetical protein
MKLKRAFQLLTTATLGWVVSAHFALAQVNTVYDNFILGDASPIDIIIAIINWTLGILALIAVVIILWGGFTWLLSQGAEDKIEKAKAILRNGLIGLVIVLAAWGIATYVINLLLDITGAGDNQYAEPYDPYEPSGSSPFYIDHSNPADGDENVPLCHIIAVTFSYPVNSDTISDSSFQVTIPQDAASNPDGGKGNNQACTDNRQCLSGLCADSGTCSGNTVAGDFRFSESLYSAVFYPAEDYQADTLYRVELTTDVEGTNPDTGAVYHLASGDSKRIFNFNTGNTTDDIPPTVDVTSVTPYPTDGDINMCLNPTLQATFSESIDPASPSDENFWLYQYTGDAPTDTLDVDNIRVTSIGGEADDTIATSPETQLSEFTEYGLNLYSGDPANDFDGAIFDTCGNALSGDFDATEEGSPVDDFVDPASSGVDQAFCSCVSGTSTCNVAIGDDSCAIDADTTCTLDSTCDSTIEDYVGFSYQWTFTTGDEPYCIPDIESISQEDNYYSEDLDPVDSTGDEDTGVVAIVGNYLYPFYDLDFVNNISAAGMNCFNTGHTADMSCFVTHVSDTFVTVRTPVASQTGVIGVTNGYGSDYSSRAAIIDSPYIDRNSPVSGPVGQYVTIRGSNFIDYDPTDATSTRGHVYFDGIEAEVMCTDGWNDNYIIVRVPDDFVVGDMPLIQVVTNEGKYSNLEGFEITDGEPGPGICELVPSCSDTGLDSVTAVGENFGDAGTAYLDPSDETTYATWPTTAWNVPYEDVSSIVTDGSQTPFTERDVYNFTAGNVDGISNGLDFEITCSEPPRLFQSNQCDLEQDTYFLPNPTNYTDNACVNSVIYFGFNNLMDDATVNSLVKVYQCNSDDAYNSDTCTTLVDGSFTTDYLNAAYEGGDSDQLLDGTYDLDGDGTLETSDGHSAYTFEPDSNFVPNYHYLVVVPIEVTNRDGVQIDQDYSWHFRIRDDATDCVADYLNVSPGSQRVVSYDATDACLDRYTSDGESYSLRARPATSDCLVLDDAGDYRWTVTEPAADDILTFGDNTEPVDTVGSSTTDSTTIGYNTVCLQGQEENNDGFATVTAAILNPNDGSVAASDDADIEVDYGFCTQDSDCYTTSCRDTYCDATTSHCAPDITSFSEDATSGADVGPGGCVTLNGCYFGASQQQQGYCTCTQIDTGETCSISDGGVACLLSNSIDSCTLGETFCSLTSACTTESASANYDLGFFRGCDCTDSSGSTCRVSEGAIDCVLPGATTCSSTSATYTSGGSGNVTFDTTDAAYPSAAVCGDTWDNTQVIVQVPTDGSVPAADYDLTLTSYYALADTYGIDQGDASDCTVGADATPCLCRAEPNSGEEGETTDLFGEGFNLLDSTSREVTFAGELGARLPTDGSETWVDDNEIDTAVIPERSVSSSDGVQLNDDTLSSNPILFNVSCNSNLDCGTGCCSNGQCAEAEVCNACANDTDCSFGQCNSACVNGTCEPYIIDVSPDTGAVGQPVTIQGCHFGTYYDPAVYDPGSQIYVDDIEAEFACNPSDSWNNVQIIATIPDGVFDDATTDSALINVQQVSTSNGVQVAQPSNDYTFLRDDSCSEVNLPVLCDANPGYSPITTDFDIQLQGENLNDEADGYCTCETRLGDCDIDEGDTDCTVSTSSTYYVNPNYTSETCADGSTGAATSNEYTYYDGTSGRCIYTDPADSSITCTIAVGQSTCVVSDSATCSADDADPTIACGAGLSNFTALDGSVDYFDDVQANIDWTTFATDPSAYLTDVPSGSETGDVQAIATTSDGTQCVSNGIEFPVTCSVCGDCGSTRDNQLNCDLTYDPAYGSCTASTTGFCRSAPSSCCNLTSCVYDDNASTTDDPGTCAAQPVLEMDDADADGMSDAYESTFGSYDNTLQDTDSDDIIDSDESGYFNGNYSLTNIDSVTFPEPSATGVCSNALIRIQFSSPITTSDVFDLNDNDAVVDDPTTEEDESDSTTDITADDVDPADIDFTDYVLLRRNNGQDPLTDNTTVLSDITISPDGKELTLVRNKNLGFSAEFEIIIRSDNSIVAGTDHQSGIVDAESGVAVGCTTEMDALGICGDGYIRYTFTTSSRTVYEDRCGPSYVVLEADDQNFIDNDYIFTESGQEEDLSAVVYAVGEDGYADHGLTDADGDGVDDGQDDQPITRIDDGTDPGFYWTYSWADIYDSISDLEAAECPVAGIITNDEDGSCSCDITETCTIALGSETCTTSNAVTCYTDSPNAVCDAFDTGYSASGCTCTVEDSCTMIADETSCSTDVNGTEVECTTDSANGRCDDADSGWSDGSFVKDREYQTLTADTPPDNADNQDNVTVTVTGDGSPEQGWGNGNASSTSDDLVDTLTYDFVYCDEDYLVSYANDDYNFAWRYCRGIDPQSESFLPEFDEVFQRSDSDIDTAYGSDQEFIYEVGFKDIRATTNDPDTNNNLIVLRVYPNDFDGDLSTPGDAVSPNLWYLLNTNNVTAAATETTIDGYNAVEVGNTVYIAATNLDEVNSSSLYQVVSPYIFVVAYSASANQSTIDAATALLAGFKFNRNSSLSDDCALQKSKLVTDTNRITDLGTAAYLLSSYYYNDTDGNDVDDFPALASGSYISGLTTSKWPSWNDNLGEVLGQTLAEDPVNTFNNASTECPYNPPDVSAGETEGTYYDESGTCWDPVLKDFYGPAESHVYAYEYNAPSSTETDFALYANLDYEGTGSWVSGTYNPCRSYVDNSTVDTEISSFSDSGCATFDYAVDNSLTTDNTTYAELFDE